MSNDQLDAVVLESPYNFSNWYSEDERIFKSQECESALGTCLVFFVES